MWQVPQELQELGGWSSFEMVLRYAHLAGDHLKSAANRFEGTLLAQSDSKKRLRAIVNR
ncbi:MAG: integrase [Candidatus Thiodiazotropha sp. (ex Notomyrtea botanica)]|nr:integrase [Candidatus Thiodiazotropha sp. (ex Notomyrtea botanica)]